MNDDNRHMLTLFAEVLEAGTPEAQAAYLDRACGGDRDMHTRLEALLRAHREAGGFLGGDGSTPDPVVTIDEPAPSEGAGTVIGPYKLLQEIGEGGMGTVYMAEQNQPVRRMVALKIIKPGMDSRQVIARFEAERQALALMDHPNIAKVLDAGTTDRGRPYFVMELVKGVPITKYCDEHRLAPRQRLELFIQVCQAVQHAHQKGIIHRDLKPSNVMVCQYDGKPVPKVIDFGVAKAAGARLTEKTLFTELGQVVGTLEYMSPEQAELNQLDIDTRSDIYSLGVLLYELLTGTTPLERKRFQAVAFLEVLRLIREEETPKPSTRLSTNEGLPSIAANRGLEPKKLSGLIRGELDWIVMKTLEKNRNRRYETANGLAQDIERYLNDEPVLACPPSAWYRFGKFVRRHKVALRTVAAAALVVVLTVVGVCWALWDQAARQSETERTVHAALVTVENLNNQAGEMPRTTSEEADAIVVVRQQAEAALAPALAALKTGITNDRLRQRVLDLQQESEQRRTQAQRKAKLLRDLDDARVRRSDLIESQFDYAGAAARYAAVFATYDLEVKPGRTDELALRIRAEESGIREALIVALDDWSDTAGRAKMGLLANELRTLAGTVDDDAWRQKYRAALTDGGAEALRALSREARKLSLSPSSLTLLAWSLRDLGERADMLALLRKARVRYPGDFWVHFVLGGLLNASKGRSALELEEAIGCYTAALALRPKASAVYYNLGLALKDKEQWDEAIAAFGKAIEFNPKFAAAHNNLGFALAENGQLDEAIAEYKKAVELNPKLVQANYNLGRELTSKKQWDEAIAAYKRAIEFGLRHAEVHFLLGNALAAKNRWDEAIAEYKKAIELDPKFAAAHFNLGGALADTNQWSEAIPEYKKTIELDHRFPKANNNLGRALFAMKQWGDAIPAFRKAIELDPNFADAHFNLGRALKAEKQLDEAIAALRKAIELNPRFATAHFCLGLALHDSKQLDEAIAEYKKAIELEPKDAAFHFNLGCALGDKNQLDEASAEYKKTIELQPDHAQAHCNLASILQSQGQLAASLDFFKRGHALGNKRRDWHYSSGQWVADAERLVRLEAKLLDVLAGKAKPTDNSERFGLLEVCHLQRRYASAARLYADAFIADPKLADDQKASNLYDAACCAALAAAGQGADADQLDDKKKSELRRQVLVWLRADLDLWSKRLEGGKSADRQVVRTALEHWQRDTDLAGVRDVDVLQKLAAEEQKAWRKLWADVAELLKK